MKRISSLDLARGFTVLMIAPIHSVMLYSEYSVRNTLLGNFLAFVAEWHGAQIFMLVMGISFSFSKNQGLEPAIKKAACLMVYAYALNTLKFVIPHFFRWLPPAMLELLQVDPGIHGYTQLFLLGDILHFAAISLIILSIIFKFKSYNKIAFWTSVSICFISPLLWDATSDNAFINYGLQLAGGQPPHVYFPLLPWLVYPLLGLTIGKIIQQKESWLGLDSFWIPGLIIITVGFAFKHFISNSDFSSFYRTTPLDTIIHTGFVMIMLSVWHWISIYVKPNYLFKLFSYASRRITRIYIIQWILICWLLPFTGYQQTGFIGSLFLIFLTSFITLTTSLFIDLAKSKKPAA
ncbi:MAG TPA: heparan-alpha-glucosaminide N-acetyltransferase domain-containing protein [Puia sp.]|jgi:uncharacterized membrane protein|nr:heparan-alpha-glucosaminide N-acetyltransferase domain-containing protein [Puia sp.]